MKKNWIIRKDLKLVKIEFGYFYDGDCNLITIEVMRFMGEYGIIFISVQVAKFMLTIGRW